MSGFGGEAEILCSKPRAERGLLYRATQHGRTRVPLGALGHLERGRPRPGSVQNLSHFRLAERHPALAHAVMAPLICWSFSNSMFRYLLVDHAVPAMWRSLAAARLSAD